MPGAERRHTRVSAIEKPATEEGDLMQARDVMTKQVVTVELVRIVASNVPGVKAVEVELVVLPKSVQAMWE